MLPDGTVTESGYNIDQSLYEPSVHARVMTGAGFQGFTGRDAGRSNLVCSVVKCIAKALHSVYVIVLRHTHTVLSTT
jgi:hypothetical protein